MGLGLILALGVSALGIYGHMDAQEMEEKAESIAKDAQHMYKKARKALDREEEKAEEALWELGCEKKKVMVQSVEKFLKTYEYIQEIRLKETKRWNGIAKRTIDANGVMQLRELSDIYQRTWIEGSVETSILSTTLISLGAGFLPSLIAPLTLSTALSASVRANENLEKAEAMYAEAELLSEKMQISKIVCRGIVEQAERFRELLIKLDSMFSKCVDLLESIVQYQRKIHGNAPLIEEDFTDGELNLMAVTCALAGSVKAVIDTPILLQDGTVSDEATCIHDEIMYQQVPQYQQEVSMFGEGMKTFAEQVKILEKTFQHSMVINAGLDYDDLQFGMRTSEHASASCMGGVFSIHGADSEWSGRNTVLFSIADIQGWTKEYGETVTRDMLRFAICHEMYFLKDMEKADIPVGNDRIYVGHGMCYLKGEIERANEKYQFRNSRRRFVKGDVYEPVIIAPYVNAAYADAYAIYIMQISMEYYYELLDNIIQYTIRKSDIVSSEYDASLKNVQENYRKRKKEAALCLVQIHKSEDMPFLRNQLPFWADNVMGNCNLAWGGFTPMNDEVENEIAMALAAIRGEIEDDEEDDDDDEEEQHDYIGPAVGSMLGSLGSMFRGDMEYGNCKSKDSLSKPEKSTWSNSVGRCLFETDSSSKPVKPTLISKWVDIADATNKLDKNSKMEECKTEINMYICHRILDDDMAVTEVFESTVCEYDLISEKLAKQIFKGSKAVRYSIENIEGFVGQMCYILRKTGYTGDAKLTNLTYDDTYDSYTYEYKKPKNILKAVLDDMYGGDVIAYIESIAEE